MRTPNGRSAVAQAAVVADNIAASAWGKKPTYFFTPHWADGVIKLTLGLVSIYLVGPPLAAPQAVRIMG